MEEDPYDYSRWLATDIPTGRRPREVHQEPPPPRYYLTMEKVEHIRDLDEDEEFWVRRRRFLDYDYAEKKKRLEEEEKCWWMWGKRTVERFGWTLIFYVCFYTILFFSAFLYVLLK